MNTAERVVKRGLKKQRILKLNEIRGWERKRCEVCAPSDTRAAAIMCKCEASTNIRRLGEELDGLAATAREHQRAALLKRAEVAFNIDLYLEMRDSDMKDVDIFTGMNVRKDAFTKWKQANGIHRGRLNRRPEVETELNRGE